MTEGDAGMTERDAAVMEGDGTGDGRERGWFPLARDQRASHLFGLLDEKPKIGITR